MAPTSFGVFSGDLLIGNFGNGRVSAYQDRGGGNWVYKGQLRRGDQALITIDGLWAIEFGNGSVAGPTGQRRARALRVDHGRLIMCTSAS